jgi:DNA polymerase-1
MEKEYLNRQKNLLGKMRHESGNPEFNPMSPPQVVEALCILGHGDKISDPMKPTKYNTSKEILGEIEHEVPLAAKILEYRTNRKILSTYVDAVRAGIDYDGRYRTAFNLHGTDSGRLSCSFLHQIPRTDMARYKKKLPVLRDMFITRPGYKYVYGDYSQIELRILAILAQDLTMLGMFERGEDLHKAAAASVLGFEPDQINDFNRQLGKSVNFGLAYGSKGFQLIKKGEWEDFDGKKHPLTWSMFNTGMERFKNMFPELNAYLQNTPDQARMNGGALITPFGRARRFGTKLNQSHQASREAAEREAVNFTIQSPAAGITLRTVNIVDGWIQQLIEEGHLMEDDIIMVNTVHDSFAYEVKDHLVDWFKVVLQEAAQREFPELDDHSFPCKIGVADNWTEAEMAA